MSLHSQGQFRHLAYSSGIAPVVNKLYSAARDDIAARYLADLNACHQAPLVRLDPGVVQLWTLERGLDAVAGLGVSSRTGLPLNACSCPTCPHFLVPMDYKYASGKMSPSLKAHHHGIKTIPGLHMAVFSKCQRTENETKDEYVKRVVEKIRGGGHIEWGHPSLPKITDKIALHTLNMRMPGIHGERARKAVAALNEKIRSYGSSVVRKICKDFPTEAELSRAVLAVLDSKVYTQEETFAVLDKIADKFVKI